LPKLPCISGRDFAAKVVKAPTRTSRFKVGESILGIATDYRDSRRSAFQQYAVVSDFNACKLPPNITTREAAPLGVAFVAAALALGVCLGLDFLSGGAGPRGPDLLQIVRLLTRESLPKDIRAECFDKLKEDERAKAGDWIVIWGGKIICPL
jgi:NADPH:quinone reductase-like Zn-dependent oxidoreductase